jgi:hypothetical protein
MNADHEWTAPAEACIMRRRWTLSIQPENAISTLVS